MFNCPAAFTWRVWLTVARLGPPREVIAVCCVGLSVSYVIPSGASELNGTTVSSPTVKPVICFWKSVSPTYPSSPVYHSPPRSKLVERYGARLGLPTVRACADGSLNCAFGSMSRGLARVMVREPANRSLTFSLTLQAALNDGRNCE